MTRFMLIALTALAAASAAPAQQLSSPPDVGTYTARAATYAAGTAPNVIGDGSNAKGGIAPAFSTVPEPVENEAGLDTRWVATDGISACQAGASSGCQEAKWRTQIESSHFGYDDPIRYWGQPGASHCHEFFGNEAVGAYTTRASLRRRPQSTAAGGPWQATGYWEPCWVKTIAGKLYAMPATGNTVYYAKDAPVGVPVVDDEQRLHLKLRFIGGVNMSDPGDATRKAEIATANAQSGTAGRYSYVGNGFMGYVCIINNVAVATKAGAGADSLHSWGFKMPDGTDPWQGQCTPGGSNAAIIYAENNAPRCWDGWNVSSPTGYDHFRYEVFDSVKGGLTCPNGWYHVPVFQVKSMHQTQGWDDYKLWSLASDAMMSAQLGTAVVPGRSAHFDWMNGQAKKLLDRWLPYCMGINGTAHQCDYSTIDGTGRLVSDAPAPDGRRNPQVNLGRTVNSNDPSQLHQVDTAHAAMIHMKGM